MKNQLNIFGTEKITVAESIELTIASLKEYGARHKHWAAAWSWGKDSTALVTLVAQLINTGQIPAPESFTVLCADTRLELTPLWLSAQVIMKQLETRGIKVKVVTAPIDDRFLVYILGRGVPPPSNTFRWCTGQIKIEPMEAALEELLKQHDEKVLMLTGVRQGESAIRDQRIVMSCSKDGAECGQGWYQTGLESDRCSTLAPILHWRVCNVWDWLKIFAPMKKYGAWNTTLLADAYGGDEAEEINARTGCIGCPLASKDKALDSVIRIVYWSYLAPLKRLKEIYREMKKPQYRLRKPGGERRKDGELSKNQQRMGPLTFDARRRFLAQVLEIQKEINEAAIKEDKPCIDILNQEEHNRIVELIEECTWPDGWDGTEPTADVMLDKVYRDGSVMPLLFKHLTTVLFFVFFLATISVRSQSPFIQKFNAQPDRDKHMEISTAIALPATIIAWKITDRQGLATLLGFLASLSVGVGKELIYDKAMGRGAPSIKDVAFDAIGSAYGAVGGTMTIGVAKHIKEVEEDKFRDLNIPSVAVADSLISDTLLITNLNN